MTRDIHQGMQKPGTALLVANTDWYLFNFRLNLFKAAKGLGWHVQFAAPDTGYFHRLETAGFLGERVNLASSGLNPFHELKAFISLARAMRRTKADVIHLFTLKCVLYGCLLAPLTTRARVIGAVTGMGYLFTGRGWRIRLLKRPIIAALKIATRISAAHLIFQNDRDRDVFVEVGIIPKSSTTVIRGSGVDCDHFTPIKRSREQEALPRLLFCGRLIEEKGIREYLEATAQLRDQGYVFDSRIAGAPYAGNPSSLSAEDVKKLAALGQHQFLGHHDDMATLFANTDIVVLPTFYGEGTPKTLLEALASGCLIVTTDIPACLGIVDSGKNGEYVKPRDCVGVASAIKKLIDTPITERDRMRAHSRYIAEMRFRDDVVNRQTLALYHSHSRETSR